MVDLLRLGHRVIRLEYQVLNRLERAQIIQLGFFVFENIEKKLYVLQLNENHAVDVVLCEFVWTSILVHGTQMVSAMLLEAFNSISVQLCVINSLSSSAFVGQEVEEFVPGHFVVIFPITLVDHAVKGFVIYLYALLQFCDQLLNENTIALGRSVL